MLGMLLDCDVSCVIEYDINICSTLQMVMLEKSVAAKKKSQDFN